MNSKAEALENEAQKQVAKLKGEFVIDGLTAERLQDIFVYLFLSKANQNPRGIEMQQAALQRVLQTLPVINHALPMLTV